MAKGVHKLFVPHHFHVERKTTAWLTYARVEEMPGSLEL
jgi:hypothetical protein